MTKRRSSKTKRHHLDGGFASSQNRETKPKRQSTNKDTAKRYAQAGVPVTTLADAKTENGAEGATTDFDTTNERWTESPNAKIVIATGAPDLVALRISGDNGRKAFRALQRQVGDWPCTVAFRTDSSWTYLFKAPPDAVPDGEVQVAQGVTFHGRGSYVIAPSSHEGSKGQGRFAKGRAIGEVDFAPAPDWLLGLISTGAGSKSKKRSGPKRQSPSASAPSEEFLSHRFAEIFPIIQESQLNVLADDIAENGLLNAIWLCERKILDGRCRYLACKMAGVDPRYQDYVGNDPVGFVIGQNLHRRHLDESQRGMVAARIANFSLGSNQHSEGTSNDAASKSMNVSKSSVDRAKKVLRHGDPEITAAVDSGKLKVSAAAAKIGSSKSEERVRKGKSGIEETSSSSADEHPASEAGVKKEMTARAATDLAESPSIPPSEAETDDLDIPRFLDRRVNAAVRAADRAEFSALMADLDRTPEFKRVLAETSPAVLEQFADFLRAGLKKVGH